MNVPLSQIAKAVPHLLSPMEREPWQQLGSAVHLTQYPLGTPEHIAAFVVNSLFNVIVGSMIVENTSMTTVPDKMTVWFKAYR